MPFVDVHQRLVFVCMYDKAFPDNVDWSCGMYTDGERQQGSWSVFPLKEKNSRDDGLTSWMNEPTVAYSFGPVDHLWLVWPMPATSLPVDMIVCVCCPSSKQQMSVKSSTYQPAACHSQFHVKQVPSCHRWVRKHTEGWLSRPQFDQHVKKCNIYIHH